MTVVSELSPANSLSPRTEQILIVDDSRSTAQALAALLKSAGYSAAISLRGNDAIAFAQQHPLAGAVIDVHLPDINGLVVTQKLRQRLGPDKPIIVFSGDTSMEVINSLAHVGATYFLSKPVNATDLMARLRDWFGEPSAE